jgi:hypothetical protein
MPKKKYTAAERQRLGIGSAKQKRSRYHDSFIDERRFKFTGYSDAEPIGETRGRPVKSNDGDILSSVLMFCFTILLAYIIFK